MERASVKRFSLNRRRFLRGVAGISLTGFVRAQPRLPLVAVLSPVSPTDLVNRPFKDALAKLGYRHGETIEIVERFSNRDEKRLPGLAAELVGLQPRVLFTNTSAAARVAARATGTIPIVVAPAGEFVLKQLAGGSLARPATNVTGFVLTSPHIDNKIIALLMEAVPTARRIGLLVNPRNPGMEDYPALQVTAFGQSGYAFVRLEASGIRDIDGALQNAVTQHVDALFVTDDSHIAANAAVRNRILQFAARARIPVASSHQTFAREGALLSMGPSIPALAARGALYVAKILEGARPADLPIELPSIFTTVVNLTTAEMLGLTVPPSLRVRADEIIQ
jgi:putative tryptophan/tyrosine transport system substrate-binding protein